MDFNNSLAPDEGEQSPPTHNPADSGSAGTTAQGAPSASGNTSSWEFAGAFTILISHDIVTATVGSTAVLESGADVDVASTFSQQYQTFTTGTLNRWGNNGKAVSLALDLGIFDEEVKATVDSKAIIDAYGALDVTATTTYPFPWYNPPADQSEGSLAINGLTQFTSYLYGLGDSTLGAQTFLANNATRSVATPGSEGSGSSAENGSLQTAGAGAITIDVFLNDTEAVIGDARINQNTASVFRGSAGNANTGQSVSVAASTNYDSVGIDGIFDINLGLSSLFDAAKSRSLSGLVGGGVQAKGTGAGAAIDINVMDNTTLAQIMSGAEIFIGSAGSLSVTAAQSMIGISLDGASASGGDVGFAGTLVWNNLYTDTTAQIEEGVMVNANPGDSAGGPVIVVATDNTTMVGIAGSFGSSEHSGYGLTLAVNNFNRTTLALIGTTPDQSASPSGNFNIGGLEVHAVNQGIVVGLTFAAAATTTSSGGSDSSGGSSGSGSGSTGSGSGSTGGTTSSGSGSSAAVGPASPTSSGLVPSAPGVGGASSARMPTTPVGPRSTGKKAARPNPPTSRSTSCKAIRKRMSMTPAPSIRVLCRPQ